MSSLPATLVDPIVEAMHAFLDAERAPGVAVAVMLDRAVAWHAGAGVADVATGAPATGDTLFRIASVTKTFTATAVLQLRDEGRLRLDDPLIRHLPEAAAIGNPFGPSEDVTIRRMLTHTAGLQADVPVIDPTKAPGLTQPQLLACLADIRLVRPPDSGWHYSNVGYELLVALIERLTGDP